MRADLHLHSTASDGRCSPREVMRRVYSVGLGGAALTDHDTVAGVEEAAREARALRLEFVPGCEISIDHEGLDIHLLAYFIDPRHAGLNGLLRANAAGRQERVHQMVRRLNDLGVGLTLDEVIRQASGSSALGRLHVARALVQRGASRTLEEAFREWIGRSGGAYLPKSTPEAREVLAQVTAAGGVAVLGHPALYGISDPDAAFASWNLTGIEVYHPAHRSADVSRLLAWAQARGYVATGGSDWHGDERPDGYVGCVQVDGGVIAELRGRRA